MLTVWMCMKEREKEVAQVQCWGDWENVGVIT